MEELRQKAPSEFQEKIDNQIRIAKYGIMGENNIAFELKNSGMDMYVLHDIYLEVNGLSAQIDYIVITRKRVYIIECKNMFGNIDIDNTGAFVRNYEFNGRKIKEGIYSPITQNERHMNVIRELQNTSKTNFITRKLAEKSFARDYKGIVVLANPKTCLNARFAKKEVKEQVIRADQLISYIRNCDAEVTDHTFSVDEMGKICDFYLQNNVSNRSDYTKKYTEMLEKCNAYVQNEEQSASDLQAQSPQKPADFSIYDDSHQQNKEPELCTHSNEEDNEKLQNDLKKFRLNQSRQEGIKPFYIFNNAQMEDLIEKNPKTLEELKHVSGFGDKKVQKYGSQIIAILNSERVRPQRED